jgi:hypothetical protein
MFAGLQSLEQPIGALGLLGSALHHATHQKELWIVAAMQSAVDGLHAGCSFSNVGGLVIML